MIFEWIAPLFVIQMEMLITIQSHSSLIILVMMWINYQLNSWSPKFVVDLLCITGCYSLDGEVNTHLTVQRHTHTHRQCLVFSSVFQQMKKKINLNAHSHIRRYARKDHQSHKQRPSHILHANQLFPLVALVLPTEFFRSTT